MSLKDDLFSDTIEPPPPKRRRFVYLRSWLHMLVWGGMWFLIGVVLVAVPTYFIFWR